MSSSALDRTDGGVCAQPCCAARAADTARSVSFSEEATTAPIRSPVEGSNTSIVSAESAAIHLPLMKFPVTADANCAV